MLEFLKDNPLVSEAAGARRRPRSVGMHFLIFFLVMTVADFISGFPVAIYTTVRMFLLLGVEFFLATDAMAAEEMMAKIDEVSAILVTEDGYVLVSLFSTALTLLVAVLYCRLIEGRSLASMGLSLGKGAGRSYALGLFLGLTLAAASFLLLWLTGALGATAGRLSPIALLYLFAFLIQGAAEEVLVRGYFMISLTGTARPGASVVLSSLLFSLLHLSNPGMSFLAALNILLFGILLGLLVFYTRNLFLAAALHGAWNFALAILFGLPVSGVIVPPGSLIVSDVVPDRMLTNGGAFGPEGGAVVTLVLLLALGIFLFLSGRTENKGADAP